MIFILKLKIDLKPLNKICKLTFKNKELHFRSKFILAVFFFETR